MHEKLRERNGLFLIGECLRRHDWLMCFFIDIIKREKGCRTESSMFGPRIDFEAIAWVDKKEDVIKSWEGKTYKTTNDKGEIVDEPYEVFGNMITPYFENEIVFKIHFSNLWWHFDDLTVFTLSAQTDYSKILHFIEDFQDEMRAFYSKYADRIEYLGSGEYKIIGEEE